MDRGGVAEAPEPGGLREQDTGTVVSGARLLVVKVGSSSLATVSGGLDHRALERLVSAVCAALERGQRVVLVSSGSVAAGLRPLGLSARPSDLALQQAAASVGQGELISRYRRAFEERGHLAAQVLLTSGDVDDRNRHRNASRTLRTLLECGAVPVVNENDTVATDELRFGDNDRLAALVAMMLRADALLLLSDVDALYDRPPAEGGRPVPRVDELRDLASLSIGATGAAGVGSGGMASKVSAACLAAQADIPTVITSSEFAGLLLGERGHSATEGTQSPGTLFRLKGSRRSLRLAWLQAISNAQGRIVVDAGAWNALRNRKSLLAPGIVEVEGEFSAGACVDIVLHGKDGQGGPSGVSRIRGISKCASDSIPVGRDATTTRARGVVVVHADDMALE